MQLYILLAAAFVTGALGIYSCDDGWTLSQDNTCLKFNGNISVYAEARRQCQAVGSDLVKIANEEKSNLVYDLIQRMSFTWFGVNDLDNDHDFKYVDGSPLDSYHPWDGKTPETYTYNSDRVYCAMLSVPTAKLRAWYINMCTLVLAFVCEKPAHYRPGICKDGWVENTEEEACIKVFNDKKATFKKARTICQNEGGDLVTLLKTNEQNKFVKGLLEKSTSYWIGISDDDRDSVYTYVDGDDLGEFNGFKKSEPNNKGGNEHCVVMQRGKWLDKGCKSKKKFVCQTKGIESQP